jgi:putative flippase GtrA
MASRASVSAWAAAKSMRQVSTFCAVGATAAAVHYAVVLALVPLGLVALLSNVVGFLTAFVVSYVGHNAWTFPPRAERRRRAALHRFFRVAITAFLVNETLFWVLLRWTSLPYQLSLALVLVIVAGGTFVASKHWAFADA